jgi:potassium-transporting ATPase KdpC subunit
MLAQILPGLKITLFITLLAGVVYPLAITGICQMIFPHQANGSLIMEGGSVIGSELIGQSFTRPEYFQPRPSAAGAHGYDATSSGGSNFGPTNQKLIDRVRASVEKFRTENPDSVGPIPADLLTASASGLDPHISPASALVQVPRIAGMRGRSHGPIRQLVAQFTEGPVFGILGEPRVNVLKLNMALDHQFPYDSKGKKNATDSKDFNDFNVTLNQ